VASKQKVVAVLSLLNAAWVWGLVWYPFRVLEQQGVSGELASFLTYFIALILGLLLFGPVWRELRRAGWWSVALSASAGWTNLGYVLAMLGGEVMRVLLLFYLAPLWTVLLSYFLLGERLNRYGYAVIALSLGGAFVMLWRPEHGWPLPQNSAEWIGLSAGFAFALTNVLIRRVQHLSIEFKSTTVWFGTALLTLLALLYHGGFTGQLAVITPESWLLIGLVALILCATSFSVQYGLTNLPANQSILLFMFELVVAAVSSYLLAGEKMGAQEIAGAVLIVAASLFSEKLHSAKDGLPLAKPGAV
jgi:drug/metabolite transporter (DMT)-like permease